MADGSAGRAERRGGTAADLPDPPLLWLTHYPRMLWSYWRRGEAGLADLDEALRAKAAARPGGKFGKGEAAYVPFVPLPPLDWRHRCGSCRFWVDQGPDEPGECMIVGRAGDRWGGKAIHEDAGCALFTPPAGEPAFAWLGEQRHPTGADLVRGEYHPPTEGTRVPVTDAADGADDGDGAAAAGDGYVPAGARVALEPVVEGLAAPVDLATDPRDGALLVADQRGLVSVHREDGSREEPLLDLRERLVDLGPRYDERGLLGLALHPAFESNGRLFVRYSAPRRAGTPETFDHTEVLAEFRVAGDRSPIDPSTERTILEVPSPQFNHNAGSVAFGPDGYLYVGMGDGGGEADRGPGHVPGGNGQDVTENLLGGILRIDVDPGADGGAYAVPADNPLVDDEGPDEYYAWGLRNPWRLSFDGEGRLFVADVGQHRFEEVNVVERGGNYGWNVREGFHCFDPENPAEPLADCPEESERGEPLLDPVLEYPHVHGDDVVGSAVVGGYVYEGDALAGRLDGAYVFGDWAVSQDRPSGRLFAARPADGGDRWEMAELVVAGTASGRPERNVLGFGRDPAGELYVLTSETHAPSGETGAVHRLVAPEPRR